MPKIKITEPLIRWIGIPIIALIPLFFTEHHDRLIMPFWQEYFASMSFTGLYWTGAVNIFHLFRRIYPEISKTPVRLIITYLCLMTWMTIGGIPLKLLYGFATFSTVFDLESFRGTLPVSIGLGFVIGTIYEAAYFFENWKRTFQINEQLKSQQIKTQFEVLQNQMSPHFLFNSLNTLTTLIAENQEVAIDFTQKLSEVYRYILQNKEKELVTIDEELEFANAYFFLLKMRYPENLQVNFNVDTQHRSKHIAPLTLQMLIENAIKHNVVSRAHPLTVDVYVQNDHSIIVKNNLQPKKSLERSTKTGLQNIKKRYQLLGQEDIDVITTAKNFMVTIPLIQLIRDRDIQNSVATV